MTCPPPSCRPYYGQVTMSPDLYPASNHLMGPADVYPPSAYLPRPANDQRTNNNYLPSVSYSLDHLDRLEFQVTSGPVPFRFHPVGLKVLKVFIFYFRVRKCCPTSQTQRAA